MVVPEKFKRGWNSGLPETPCGIGSKFENTQEIRKFIENVIKKYSIKTIADIGAGDQNWIRKTDLNGAEYQGYDVYPRNNDIREFNIIETVAPKSDLLLCIYVLNHLEMKDAHSAFQNLINSGSKYLIITDHMNDYFNFPLNFIEKAEIYNNPNRPKRHIGLINVSTTSAQS